MNYFWQGFEEKLAIAFKGIPGVQSGLKTVGQGGRIVGNRPASGVSIGARSAPPPLPTPNPSLKGKTALPPVPPKTVRAGSPQLPKMPDLGVKKQTGKGVSSMAI